jgi:hypothetical protein
MARHAAIGLLAMVLASCGEPEPPVPPSPMTIALGDARPSAQGMAYTVRVTNDGETTSAVLGLGCRFTDAQGVLIFTGGLRVEPLAPGATQVGEILVPNDVAGRIAGLSCTTGAE